MSDIQSHENIHKQPSWPKKTLLTRTKPIDSFTELCQQLTNVVAQQTTLSEKLIEAFRETKEAGQNNLQIPYRENNRYSPSPDLLEESNRLISFKVPSVESPDEEMRFSIPGPYVGEESLNALNTNIEMVRSCNYAAMNQLRSVLTGQIHQDNLPNALSHIYSMVSLVNTQCENCKTSLTNIDHILRERNIPANTGESKSTQTESVEVESDPEDKDSGLESNPGRNSETGVSLEDFQIYTEYDELMQASIPDEVSEVTKRRPSFLKDKKNSCPTHLLKKKIQLSKVKTIDGIKESSVNEDAVNTPGENNSAGKQLDDTLVCSPKTPDVFSPHNEPAGVQSFPVDFREPEKKKLNLRPPKLAKLQRAMTICNPESGKLDGLSEEDESLNLTQSSGENERDADRDFANIEGQVNIIKFNYSTNSFTSKGRKEGLKQLVYTTRKQVSCQINELINKINSNKRRKGPEDKPESMEGMTKSFLERIDNLIQVSQHFGAILHENTHSDEIEILINFIETVKTLHRPSIPTSGSANFTYQRTESTVSSGENERRVSSPTARRYSLKAMETTYEKGIKEGVEFMKGMLQTEIKSTNQSLDKFHRYSTEIETVINSEMRMKKTFLLSYGLYIVSILVISVILMFVM